MAVAYNSKGTGGNGSKGLFTGGAVTASWTHSCSGTKRLAIVAGNYHDSSNTASGSITITATYGGQSMTELASIMHNNTSTGDKTTLFYLTNPPTGSQTVAISCSSPQVNRGCMGNSLVFTGVEGLGPVVSAAGSTSSPSVTFEAFGNGYAVSAITWGGASSYSYDSGTPSGSTAFFTEGDFDGVIIPKLGNGSFTQGATPTGHIHWAAVGIGLVGDQPFFGML